MQETIHFLFCTVILVLNQTQMYMLHLYAAYFIQETSLPFTAVVVYQGVLVLTINKRDELLPSKYGSVLSVEQHLLLSGYVRTNCRGPT